MANGTQVLDPDQEDPLVAMFRESQETRDAPAPGTAAGTEQVDLVEQFRISEGDRLSAVPPPPVTAETEEPSLLERGAAMVRRGRDLLLPQDRGRRGLPTDRPTVSVQPPERTRPLTDLEARSGRFGPPIIEDEPPQLGEIGGPDPDLTRDPFTGRMVDPPSAPAVDVVAEAERFTEELGLQPMRVPRLQRETSLFDAFQQRPGREVIIGAKPDAVAQPEPVTGRRAFGSAPQTIRGATAPERMTASLTRARMRDEEAIKERFADIPLPVRVAHSAARGAFDAVSLGRVDDLVDRANRVVAASFGVDAPAITTEDIFGIVDRGLLEKGAGGAAFLATFGGGIALTNRVVASSASLFRGGTRARAILETFDPRNPVSLGARALQSAVEGVPFDLAFDADNAQERMRNLAAGLVIGAVLGPVFGGKIKAAEGSPLGATGVAEEFLAGARTTAEVRDGRVVERPELEGGPIPAPEVPLSRDRVQPEGRQTAEEAIRATSDTEGLPGISERVETDPVPQSTRQRRSQSRGDSPGRRASDLEAQPVEITAAERLKGELDPARDIDPEIGVQSQPTWVRARRRFEANPDVEIIFFDVRQLKSVNDYVSWQAGTAELKRIAQLILKEAEGLGISPRQVFRAGGDEFAIPVPVGEGERVARSISEAVGTKRVGDTEFETSLRWGVGQTQDAADFAQATAKARETGPRHRGAGGAKRATDVAGADTPRADVTETSRASDRLNPDVETRTAPTPEGPASTPRTRPRDVSDPPPAAAPLGVQANGRGGFFDLDTLTRARKAAKAFIRRRFTSAGDLPKPIYELKIKASGWVSSQMSDIRFTLRRYDRALEQSYGTRTPDPEDILKLNEALSGKLDLDQIPAPMRPVLTSMREQIDALSSEFIDKGIAKGKMVGAIADNMGTYLTRSYRVFDDPNWVLQNIPDDIVNAAHAFLRAERPDLDSGQIEGLIKKILDTQDTSPLSFLQGTLGSKDLSMLVKRKDIHPSIRALMGEFKDAKLNYARSVTKMSNTIANHEFLTEVAREFTGTPGRAGGFFFKDAVTRGDQDFTELIAAKGSEVMAPLNGLHTTPEIATAFEEAFSHRSFEGWLGVYMKANGLVKFDKTVLSLMTHNRNVIGNIGFAVANGHWRMQHAGRALQAINASVGVTNAGRRLGRRVGLDLEDTNLTKWEEYYKKLQRLGVVDQSAHAGELQDVILDATRGGIKNVSANPSLLRKALTAVTDVYRAEDDFWKVIAFENEFARYRKALGADVPDAVVEENAAWIVRNTYPTYSMVPSGVKLLRRSPLIGSFTSFPAEVYRTLYHTITIGAKEVKSPNAEIRKIGAQRLTGLAVAGLGLPAASMASRYFNGVTADNDRDLRPFLAPWSRNSTLIYTDKGEDGTFRFIDMSYTDPYSYVRDPIRAVMLGEDWEGKLRESVLQAFSPFFSEEILAGKVFDVARNTKKSGGQVWNPEAHPIDQFQDIAAHFWNALEPGTISSARRIAKGISGQTTVFGQAFDARLEAMAVLTGHRLQKVDVKQSLSFRTGEMSGRIRNANRILTRTGTRRGTLTNEELTQAFEESEASRVRVFSDAHDIAQAAIRLGLTSREVEVAFRDGGMSRANARAVISGEPPPRRQLNSEFRERNALIRTLNQARGR